MPFGVHGSKLHWPKHVCTYALLLYGLNDKVQVYVLAVPIASRSMECNKRPGSEPSCCRESHDTCPEPYIYIYIYICIYIYRYIDIYI